MAAFVVFHVNVEVFPAMMFAGLAESVAVGAAACTFTVATAVTVLLPVAVRVYWVVAVGVIVVDPDADTAPMPLSMVTEVAFVVVRSQCGVVPRCDGRGGDRKSCRGDGRRQRG